MGKDRYLFDKIATVYGLFFNRQVRAYESILNDIGSQSDISIYKSAMDIGCGTGALCKVLNDKGIEVTGVDNSKRMLEIAREKLGIIASESPCHGGIKLAHGNVLEGLGFEDKSFDLVISSYVAHGLTPKERQILYNEMERIARKAVIFFDYNKNRFLITDILEWLEGGDYFNFINSVEEELESRFGNLRLINTGKSSAAYICHI